jgi:phage-related protein
MATPFDSTKAKEIVDILERGGSEADAIVNAFKRLDFEFTRVSTKARQWGDNLGEALETIVETRKKQALLESGLSRMNNEQKALYQSVVKTTGGYDLSSKIQAELMDSANNLKYALEEQARVQAIIDAKQQEMLVTSGDVKDALMEEVRALEEQKKISGKIVDLEKERFKTAKLTQAVLKSKEFIFKELNIPSSFVDLFAQTFERFKEIDKVTTKVRQQFGLLRKDAEGLEDQIRNTSVQLADFGATATDIGETVSVLGKNFSYISGRNDAMVKDITIFSKQMGISAETSAKFLKTVGGISGKSAESKTNMLSMTGAAAKAYGVGLEDVMNEVADASDDVRMYAGKNADEMVRAAAQARQMGTTLSNMASTAKGLLNFESSIQNELKASALIGKNINFNEARRLAFQGKVVEANKVILDQAKKIKFNQLNPLAQEAFAQAAGKSVKELQDMLEAETRIKDALNSQDPTVRKIAEEKLKEQKALKDSPKLAQQKYEQDLKTQKNQERMVQLQNAINQQLQKLMLPTLELITKTMDLLVGIFNKFKPEELIAPLIKVRIIWSMITGELTIFTKIVGGSLALITNVLLVPFRSLYGIIQNVSKLNIFKSAKTEASLLSGLINTIGDAFNWITNVSKRITDFTSKFKKLFSEGNTLSKTFLEAGKTAGGIFEKLGNKLSGLSKPIDWVISVFKALKSVVMGVVNPIISAFEPIFGSFNLITKESGKLGKVFKAVFNVGKTGLKSIPVLGEVIMAIELIMNLWKRFSTIWSDPNLNMGQKILASLVAIPAAIYDVLVQPFIDIGKWIIKAVFGEKILNGIISVADKVFYFLKWPFVKAYEWIMSMLGGKSPSKIGLSIVNGIVSIGSVLLDGLLSPYKLAWSFIKQIFTTEMLQTILSTVGGLVVKVFNFITTPYKMAWNLIKNIFTVDMAKTILSVLKSIVVNAFELITLPYRLAWSVIKKIFTTDTMETVLSTLTGLAVKVFDIVTTPYKMAWNLIKSIFTTEMLSTILSTLNGAVSSIFDSLVTPFKLGFDFIKSTLESVKPIISEIGTLFGNVFSATFNSILKGFELVWKKIKSIFTVEILTTIISSLKSITSDIFNLITSPFKTSFDLIKSLFETIKPLISEIGTVFGNIFGNAFNGILKGLELVWEKIKGIGGFIMDVVGKGISLVTNIVGGGTTEPTKAVGEPGKTPVGNDLVDAIVNSNRLVVERLDKLTQLMSSGQIAVYIDGQKANQLLAASSNKFGSLGQATTF